MAAGSTYTPIMTATLSSAVATYTFNSIPNTYTDLILVVNGTLGSTGTQGCCILVNGNTSGYSCTQLDADGSAVAAYRETDASNLNIGVLAGSRQTDSIFHFMNYANTTTNKTIIARGNDAGGYIRAAVGTWRSTAAINSISITNPSTTYQVGTTLTLYGITAA